eukprot:Gregarina_sp_Poly_1__6836@NODE_36_length_18572_cov_139_626047_g31_i0_p5_GENE_NODE_36_length_18572_cov_139_626047_g31_i0NODE_36_length_18572_cov_139_626047_g31_i0_p5_ORF_typecomplete_len265_score18_00_NODE_36_length_18572_cov_139_626047_g31_i08981692
MVVFIEGMACVGKTTFLLSGLKPLGYKISCLDYIEMKARYPNLNFADYRKGGINHEIQSKLVLKNLVSTFTYNQLLHEQMPCFVDRSPFCGVIYELIWGFVDKNSDFDFENAINKEFNSEFVEYMRRFNVAVFLEKDFAANVRRATSRNLFDVSFHNIRYSFWQYKVFYYVATLAQWKIIHVSFDTEDRPEFYSWLIPEMEWLLKMSNMAKLSFPMDGVPRRKHSILQIPRMLHVFAPYGILIAMFVCLCVAHYVGSKSIVSSF